MIRILGIDPGSRTTGYALLSVNGKKLSVESCDVLRMEKMASQPARLQFIFEEIKGIIQKWKPDEGAIETPVYGVDPLAMLKLGRAQAAAILAMTNQKLPVSEYYPKAVKKAITGNGNASKKQIAFMLDKVLCVDDIQNLSADATDALAVAWCHHLKSVNLPGSKKQSHQNNRKSGWASFVEENPDRVL